jgi:hypothetical protein
VIVDAALDVHRFVFGVQDPVVAKVEFFVSGWVFQLKLLVGCQPEVLNCFFLCPGQLLAVGEANEDQIESCSPEDYSFALELCKAFHKCSGNKGSLENNISLWIKDAIEIVSPFETIDEVIKPLRHALLRSDDHFWQQGKLITMRQVKKALPTLINQFANLQRIIEQHPNWSFDYEVVGSWKGLYELKARDAFAIGAQIWIVKGKGILERECIDAETAASLPGTDDDGNPRDAQEVYIDCTPILNVGEDI